MYYIAKIKLAMCGCGCCAILVLGVIVSGIYGVNNKWGRLTRSMQLLGWLKTIMTLVGANILLLNFVFGALDKLIAAYSLLKCTNNTKQIFDWNRRIGLTYVYMLLFMVLFAVFYGYNYYLGYHWITNIVVLIISTLLLNYPLKIDIRLNFANISIRKAGTVAISYLSIKAIAHFL